MANGETGDKPAAKSLLEEYKLARTQIEHENTLVGQRITWFLTFQGFLFGAYFVAFSALVHDPPPAANFIDGLRWAVWALAVLGGIASLAALLLVLAAYRQVDEVVTWWKTVAGALLETVPPLYPKISGAQAGPFRSEFLFVIIIVFWAGLGCLYNGVAQNGGSHIPTQTPTKPALIP